MKKELSTTQVIALGFLLTIAIGTLLLWLPISSSAGEATPLVDALFTATTSVCVTGLVVVDTYAYWSLFGQAVILILIQIGGLGVVSITTAALLVAGKKVTLKDRLLIESAFNLNTMSGLVSFLIRILKGTFLVEGIGALCYAFVFVPEMGLWKGLWASVFNGVSAFCNAGIDVIGANSLAPYVSNVWVNLVTMALIMLGGLGFVVWWDALKVIGMARRKEIPASQMFRKCTLHTKLVLVTTGILIVAGAVLVFMLEYTNPETLGGLPLGDKVLASLFQSVTTRTAGFFTISQKGLRDATVLISVLLMFVGGSPSGTAGGIKTTTVAMLFVASMSIIKGTEEANVYNRTIPLKTIRKALAVALVSIVTLIAGIIVLSFVSGGALADVAFEIASATATVGLTRSFTATLNTASRLVVVLCMYLGRIGPISMAIAIQAKKRRGLSSFPEEDVPVG